LAPANPAQTAPSSAKPEPRPETTDTAAPASGRAAASRLGPLAQLPGEDNRAYAALIRFAFLEPALSIAEFARDFGFNRRTVTRWKTNFNWDERLRKHHEGRAISMVAVADTASTRREAVSAAQLDLRAQSMDLARAALQSWLENADQPATLPGVVRALEFALKLNPGPSASSADPAERANAEFLARIEKIYGASSRASQCPTSEKPGKAGQSETNSDIPSQRETSNAPSASRNVSLCLTKTVSPAGDDLPRLTCAKEEA
jgi:hypothetical protein